MTDTSDGLAGADLDALDGANVLLGVSGSIAAYKAAELVRLLKKAGANVQVLLTADAARFVTPLTLGTLSEREVLTEIFPDNETGSWTKHVHLGLWADVLVVAPATATTLFKLAHGVCDNMLTAAALSRRCPLLACPAMDHDMWHHPATQRNVALLEADGALVMPPESGPLASGLIGQGRLPEPAAIARRIAGISRDRRASDQSQTLAGKTVLVTAGPTREHLDPVRFLSNPSTGTMGYALAAEAARRGAQVTLLSGPTALDAPPGVTRIDVTSADDLDAAARQHGSADLVIAAAAVADYRPAERHDHKIKKEAGQTETDIRFVRTPDVLAGIGERKRPGQVLVGFALETQDGDQNARAKMQRKALDWIVLNYANEPGAGFGTGTNRVALLGADGSRADFPAASKADIAAAILDRVAASLA